MAGRDRSRLRERVRADLTERRRAWALGWTAGLAVVASFAFMLFNYFHSVIGVG